MVQINRKHIVVNLDPANDQMAYKVDIDIKDLICLDDVMEETQLGPNGGLVYCLMQLENNLDWLLERLKAFPEHYVIIDLPGQLELFVDNPHLLSILARLGETIRLVSVGMFESTHCYQRDSYTACCIYSLTLMVNLALPHLNVLSKVDLLKELGRLPEQLSFYLEADELDMLYS